MTADAVRILTECMNTTEVSITQELQGDSAEYTFTGTGIDVITTVNTDGGETDVYIDGEFVETVNTMLTNVKYPKRANQMCVFSKTDLPYGEHTIKTVNKSGHMTTDAFRVYEEEGFNQEKDLYTVTVENGTGSGEYPYNAKVTAEAEAEKDGKAFTGWKVDDCVVSLDQSYTFYVSGDVTVTAVYEAVEQKAEALLTNVTAEKRDDGKYNVKFVGQLVVPEGYSIKNAGLVWSSKDGAELELGAGMKETYISRISNTNQFSVTIKGVPAGKFLRGRIFATLEKDAEVQAPIYSAETRAVVK